MDTDYEGHQFDRLGMRVGSHIGAGLVGQRWSIGLIDYSETQQPFAKVVEIVDVITPIMESQCDHMTRLVGQTDSRGLAHVIATEWIGDQQFAAIFDLSPKAVSLKSVLAHLECRLTSEKNFWAFAAQLFRNITHFQRLGFAHGGIAPATIMADIDSLILDGFWWSTRLYEGCNDREQLRFDESSKRSPRVDHLPAELSAFAAPEVCQGELPTFRSDMYSMGAILQQLLLLQVRANAGKEQDSNEETDTTNPPTDFRECTELVAHLMETDPQSRPARFELERRFHENLLGFVDGPWPSTWEFEVVAQVQIGLSSIPPNQLIKIVDIYHAYEHIHVHCQHERGDAWLSVQGFYCIGPKTYLALAHPPDQTDRCDRLPFMAASLVDDWHLRPVSELEFSRVKEGLTENIVRGTGDDLSYAGFLLGPIARRDSA